jgi:hypothetical protein
MVSAAAKDISDRDKDLFLITDRLRKEGPNPKLATRNKLKIPG